MSEENTEAEAVERIGTFRLAFGITYWMSIQGVCAFAALREISEGSGWMWLDILCMWLDILCLGLATLMLWYKVDKWRTP